ncbi:MAG: phage tail assembly protein [Alphaproteobacteria bacterium]|nr:phage tail assembly protein [Alphaproteobacteria bacterium]
MTDELTLTLRKPIEHGGQTITELKLREPTAEEIATATDGVTNGSRMHIHLISIVAGLPKIVIGRMAARDFTVARNFVESFLLADLPTGPS